MFLDDERAFFDELPAPTKAYFTQGRQLHDAIFRELTSEIKIGRPIDRDVAQTVLALLAKGLQTSRGIELVTTAGLTGDALALLRSLFEATLAAQWILQKEDEQEQRRTTFAAYELNQHIKMARAIQANRKLGDVDMSEELNVFNEALDSLRKQLKNVTWKDHWSGLPGKIEEVSKRLDLHDWYDTVFRYSSGALHANALRQLLQSDGGFAIDVMPNARELPMVLGGRSELLWRLAKTVFDAIGLDSAALDSARPTPQ